MALTDLPIPPKPSRFTPDGAPVGFDVLLEAYRYNGTPWWQSRPKIVPRVTVVHTNAASREGSVQSAINWGNAGPTSTTHPHYQIGLPRPTKLVPTDRRAIGNSTTSTIESKFGVSDSSFWSIVIETADMGTIAAAAAGYPSGDLGPFLRNDADLTAQAIAYEAVVWDIPAQFLIDYLGRGVVSHTDPFGYGYFTTVAGKTCPGGTKKFLVRTDLIPRAAQIVAAWTDTTPPEPPPEDDDMPQFVAINSNPGTADGFHFGDRITRRYVSDPNVAQGMIARGGVHDWHTKKEITSTSQVTKRPAAEWADGMGEVRPNSTDFTKVADGVESIQADTIELLKRPTGGGASRGTWTADPI